MNKETFEIICRAFYPDCCFMPTSGRIEAYSGYRRLAGISAAWLEANGPTWYEACAFHYKAHFWDHVATLDPDVFANRLKQIRGL